MAGTYKKETQMNYEKKIQEKLAEMPKFVQKYFLFIKLSTAASTRWSYLKNIEEFLNN